MSRDTNLYSKCHVLKRKKAVCTLILFLIDHKTNICVFQLSSSSKQQLISDLSHPDCDCDRM